MNATPYETYSKFISSLFGPDDNICFCKITPDKKILHEYAKREKALSVPFFESLRQWNNDASVYFGLNPFNDSLIGTQGNGRSEANVGRIARLYVDIDANALATVENIKSSDKVPPPTAILETSPGKFQVIWNISGMERATAKQHLASLIRAFNTDASCKDVARLFRLPGFKNHKYSDKPIVKLLEPPTPREYAASDFKLPLVEEKTFDAPVLSEAIANAELQRHAEIVRANLAQVGISCSESIQSHSKPDIRFDIKCPWVKEHSQGIDEAAIFAYADGFGFKCFHDHCAHRDWHAVRSYIDSLAQRQGRSLSWNANPDDSANSNPPQGVAITTEALARAFPTFDGEDVPEIPMLIQDLLPKGVSFFASHSGIGKTWVALSVAHSLITGEKLFGVFDVPEKVAVLYLCPEASKATFKNG